MDKINALVACGSDSSLKERLIPSLSGERDISFTFCANGKSALNVFSASKWDLCVIHEMLPQMPGFQLTRRIRKENGVVPLIFLNKECNTEAIYRAGADIVMPVNFNPQILSYRAAALLRRCQRTIPSLLHFGPYTFDLAVSSLNSKEYGAPVKLTAREGGILYLLLCHAGHTLHRSEILQSVWKKDSYFNGRSMDVLVAKMRRKLAPVTGLEIETVHGIGLRLNLHAEYFGNQTVIKQNPCL